MVSSEALGSVLGHSMEAGPVRMLWVYPLYSYWAFEAFFPTGLSLSISNICPRSLIEVSSVELYFLVGF